MLVVLTFYMELKHLVIQIGQKPHVSYILK